MSENLEDGIWECRDADGDSRVYYVKDGSASCWLRNGCLLDDGWRLSNYSDTTPLRRLATLDGKPVVDEGVIEAIVDSVETALAIHGFRQQVVEAVQQHLCPAKQEPVSESPKYHISKEQIMSESHNDDGHDVAADGNYHVGLVASALGRLLQALGVIGNVSLTGPELLAIAEDAAKHFESSPATPTINRYRENATGEEWLFLPEDCDHKRWGLRLRDNYVTWVALTRFASDFTPFPAPAEGPIVNFPGAFVCWWKDGTVGDYTAWPSCGGMRYMRNDGQSSGWIETAMFDRHFTRQPPITLPPELEKLVQPLAAGLEREAADVRAALVNCVGG